MDYKEYQATLMSDMNNIVDEVGVPVKDVVIKPEFIGNVEGYAYVPQGTMTFLVYLVVPDHTHQGLFRAEYQSTVQDKIRGLPYVSSVLSLVMIPYKVGFRVWVRV